MQEQKYDKLFAYRHGNCDLHIAVNKNGCSKLLVRTQNQSFFPRENPAIRIAILRISDSSLNLKSNPFVESDQI